MWREQHRMGDAGLLDQGGRLWLLGRCAARIEDSRGVLYPLGVECAAMTFPGVRRAAALGDAGRRLLVIEGDEGAGLKQRLRDAAAWASVDDLIFVRAIPVDKRHNAKIDYQALRRQLRPQLSPGEGMIKF